MNFRSSDGGRVQRRAIEVDLTALVDVVFQLLIFFLLTSNYVVQQSQQAPQVPVELPESSLEAEEQPIDDFTVVVDADGQLFIGENERVSLEELAVRFARARDKEEQTVVLIRGDQDVSYGRIAEVMAVARAARLPISAILRNPD